MRGGEKAVELIDRVKAGSEGTMTWMMGGGNKRCLALIWEKMLVRYSVWCLGYISSPWRVEVSLLELLGIYGETISCKGTTCGIDLDMKFLSPKCFNSSTT